MNINTTLNQALYARGPGTTSSDPFVTVFSDRDPTTADVNYPIQKRWVNIPDAKEWMLVSYTFDSATGTNLANWILLSNQGGDLIHLTGNTGGPVSPTLNNINIVGDGTTVTVTGNPGTSTLTISLVGGGTAVDSFAMQTGTSPVVPNGLGLVTFNGAAVAAGTNPVRTNGTGANTMQLEVQRAQAIGATNASNVGLAAFDSARFTVDANGFVSTSGTGVLNTLSDDVNTVVTPAAGNIQLVGHVNEQGSTKFSTIVAGTNLLNINPMSGSRWIVDPLGFNGTHTTIASALTSATSGDTIFIMVGTYTENLTLKAGVNLVAFGGDQITPTVTIVGNCTASFAGTCTLSNIRLQTNSAACLTVSGSSATIVNLYNCYINASNNTAISYTSSSASARIRVTNCMGDIATTGIALYASSSAGQIAFLNSNFTNTGGSTTANTISAGSIIAFTSSFSNPTTSSGTAATAFELSDFSTVAQNVTAFTNGGSGNATAFLCRFVSGTAVAISTSQLLTLATCTIDTGNAAAISGAGSIQFSNLSFASSKVISVTTQTGGAAPGLTNTSPAAGYLGERLSTTVTGQAPANGTPTTIITLALTPGVWDISAIGSFGFTGNSTTSLINISSTTNTIVGVLGDQYNQWNQANTIGFFCALSVPCFRVAVTTNTNYFCVVQANYTTGTVAVNARMSAVRVG